MSDAWTGECDTVFLRWDLPTNQRGRSHGKIHPHARTQQEWEQVTATVTDGKQTACTAHPKHSAATHVSREQELIIIWSTFVLCFIVPTETEGMLGSLARRCLESASDRCLCGIYSLLTHSEMTFHLSTSSWKWGRRTTFSGRICKETVSRLQLWWSPLDSLYSRRGYLPQQPQPRFASSRQWLHTLNTVNSFVYYI